MMGLNVNADTPVIGIVTRLVGHKGVDLMKEVLEKSLWERDVQYIVLGSGEWQYESFFRELHNTPIRLGFALALCLILQERFMQVLIYS